MLTIVLTLALAGAGEDDRTGIEFFEKKVRPILVERCYKCHGPEALKAKGGLRLDTRSGLLEGGGRGPAIVPGHPGKSLLIRAIRHLEGDLQMPPREKLSEEETADLAAWVEMGAPDPRTASAEVSRRTPDPALARAFWSFQPPRPPPLPEVKDGSWARTPIDRFILAKIEEEGLAPSPPADRRSLLRRASYDLTGLPPAAEEVEAFMADPSPDAFTPVVERLLASPRYGERWGRYWLDVARYADTKGYVYTDREESRFVHSHAYRDWVIRAFNEDMPYDRFLLLQIAADRLVEEGGEPRDLAALGFLTVGRRLLNNIHDIIDDRIDVVMRGLQGLTVSCARCHDHKFDPIPTEDYYSLYGVFGGASEKTVCLTRSPARTQEYLVYEKEMKAREEKLDRTFRERREQLSERLRAQAGQYLSAVLEVEKLPTEEFYAFRGPEEVNPVVARHWQAYLFGLEKGLHPVFAPWHALTGLPREEFQARAPGELENLGLHRVNPLVAEALVRPPPASAQDVAARYGRVLEGVRLRWKAALEEAKKTGAPPPSALGDPAGEELRQVLYGPDSPAGVPPGSISEIEWFFEEPIRVELAKLQTEIDRWLISSPGAPPHAVILADRPGLRDPRVFLRGNPANRAHEVPRRFLRLLSGERREPFRTGSGRLELARAIASRENPLTARVMVNRIWLHHFGSGLVRTPSDFGTRSEPPSHPGLLDFLALRFIESGWSLKAMHRLILLSSVYQQAAAEDPRSLRLDPENRLLSRMNRSRLDWEALRDSLLRASGELDLAMGGPAVNLFTRPASVRRTVYGFVDRQFLPGVLRVFDFANPDQHSPQRHATTVPQQALFLLNSPFVLERARALGARRELEALPRDTTAGRKARIDRLYRLVYQRSPSPREVEAGLAFLASAEPEPAEAPPPVVAAWKLGYGEFDGAAGRVKNFEPLPHWSGEAWQGGPRWPDEKLGWVQLTAEGGHAGNDAAHAAVRRFAAPRDGAMAIRGTLKHSHQEGDGVRGRIVSSRAGLLGEWTVHNRKVETNLESVEVKKGDTIDFLVDLRENLGWDDFAWAPLVKSKDEPALAGYPLEWNAKKEFSGPPEAPPPPLEAWEKYAQVLLLSNEFVFLD